MVSTGETTSSKTRDLALLRAYEPIVRFDDGEPFLPIEVDSYVRCCALWSVSRETKPRCLVPSGGLTIERLAPRAARRETSSCSRGSPNRRWA